jgi:mannose-1-phosphate guanylyltransferase
VGDGLFGFPSGSYWLDIGTPERYLRAMFDILEGNVATEAGRRLRDAGLALVDGAEINGRVVAPSLVASGCVVAEQAIVGGRAVLGSGVRVDEGAHIEASAVFDGATIGAWTTVRSSILGPEVTVGEHCHIDEGVVLGAGVKIGPNNALSAGARILPGVELPEGAIKS